jgi:magnesium transporter
MNSPSRKPPVGAQPGTLVISADAATPAVRVFGYSEEILEEHGSVDIERLVELKGSGSRLWVDVRGLGDEDLLRQLAEVFAIHPLALEDLVHAPVRPKAEFYEENLLIISRTVGWSDENQLEAQQVSLVVGDRYVLTFQEDDRDVLNPVRRRLTVQGSRIRKYTSDYLAYAILDTIIDSYYPVMEKIAERLESLEDWVLDEASPETPRELNDIKGRLLVLRRAIAPQRESVQTLIRGDEELVSDMVRLYLRDTFDHVLQIAETVEQNREFVSGLMNTYLTVVSNRIFIPLTFLAGIYGMNFEHMPELGARWAYPVLLGIMALVTVGWSSTSGARDGCGAGEESQLINRDTSQIVCRHPGQTDTGVVDWIGVLVRFRRIRRLQALSETAPDKG